MSRGKTTTMLGLRVKDDLMAKLDEKCKDVGKTRSELLIPVIARYVGYNVGGTSGTVKVPRDMSECRWVRDESDGVVLREVKLGPEFKVKWEDTGPPIMPDELEKLEAKR